MEGHLLEIPSMPADVDPTRQWITQQWVFNVGMYTVGCFTTVEQLQSIAHEIAIGDTSSHKAFY